jgi:hypothetical protein
MEYVVWASSGENIPPRTVDRYLTGIRHLLTVHGSTSGYSVFDDVTFSMVRKGLRTKVFIRENQNDGHAGASMTHSIEVEGNTEKMPVVAQQYDYLRATMWENPEASLDDNMAYIACAAAGNVVLRAGEIAYVGPYYKVHPITKEMVPKKLDHRIMLSQVLFGTPEGRFYSYQDYVNLVEPWPYVDFMRWTANTSKSSGGKYDGKNYYFNRSGSDREIQFFEDFIEWVRRSGIRSDNHPIFTRVASAKAKTETKALNSRMVSEALKKMGEYYNISREAYSPISLRRGGMTSMATAGRSDADTLRVSGQKNIETAVIYMGNTGTTGTGNVFRNDDASAPTVNQLKKSYARF